ncbi:hypothetical protein BC830DRAFT_814184 [Chytriomyces sp. MP71]|nr:hypothetical protein BC830DRAFT_814184 [Chytriomyces sp. MP71]
MIRALATLAVTTTPRGARNSVPGASTKLGSEIRSSDGLVCDEIKSECIAPRIKGASGENGSVVTSTTRPERRPQSLARFPFSLVGMISAILDFLLLMSIRRPLLCVLRSHDFHNLVTIMVLVLPTQIINIHSHPTRIGHPY